MNLEQKQRLEQKIADAVEHSRSMVLDSIELLYGETPHWSYLRKQLLKIFGDRGLTARIREIFNSEYDKNWGDL